MKLILFITLITALAFANSQEVQQIIQQNVQQNAQLPNPPKSQAQPQLKSTVQPQKQIKTTQKNQGKVDINNKEFQDNFDESENKNLQQKQKNIDKLQWERREAQLHEWVAEEMNELLQNDDFEINEVFSFIIDKEVQFKWNPSQKNQGDLKFVVEVFGFDNQDFVLPENPEENNYISVHSQPEGGSFFTSLGRVYIRKQFTINLFSDFQILRFDNQFEQKMLIRISLQATKFVPEKALDDDELKIPAEKIKNLLEEIEQTQRTRQMIYKTQWSFKDRQQHHQSEMLILTGVEMAVIIGTAIVQIYCLKNLFESRLIV